MNENNKRDDMFRNRIREALHQLNRQSNGFDSNAAIEAELADIDAAPMSDRSNRYDTGLEGRIALVTGGGSGIGAAIAATLRQAGATVRRGRMRSFMPASITTKSFVV